MTMVAKLNQFATRFLKSILALAVVILLLSMALCLTPLYYLASAEYILIFSLVALLLSACILIPIKFIKVLLKVILSIGALLLAPFYLINAIGLKIFIIKSIENDPMIRDSLVRFVLLLLSWLITISTACKEGASDMRAPVEAHARNLQFFKKFIYKFILRYKICFFHYVLYFKCFFVHIFYYIFNI